MSGFSEKLLHNLEIHQHSQLCVTAITCTELLYGAHRKKSKRIFEKIAVIFSKLIAVPFDQNAAEAYADLRSELESSGTPIGNMDMLIAACAIANKAIPVTNNTKHFSKISNLKIQNRTE
jgi:tRNA(fMet)-specific endonuclease VapC